MRHIKTPVSKKNVIKGVARHQSRETCLEDQLREFRDPSKVVVVPMCELMGRLVKQYDRTLLI